MHAIVFAFQPSVAVSVGYDAYWKQTTPGFHNYHTPPGQLNHLQSSDSKATYGNFVEQQKSVYTQPDLQYPVVPQVPQGHQTPEQISLPVDAQRVSKVQILTNPRIVSNLAFGLAKTEKAASGTSTEAKPAYISVSFPKPNEKPLLNAASDSTLKVSHFFQYDCLGTERKIFA